MRTHYEKLIHKNEIQCHFTLSSQLHDRTSAVFSLLHEQDVRQTESTGCSPPVHPNSSEHRPVRYVGSATQYALAMAILRCWQAISTRSGAGTPPPVHTATALTRRQSTWCSGVQLMTRPEETSDWEEYSTRLHDASGSSWSGLGR